MAVICAKTAELIQMPFGLWARTGPRSHQLDGGPDPPPGEGAILGERKTWSEVIEKDCQTCQICKEDATDRRNGERTIKQVVVVVSLVMVALCNRADHNIFMLFLLSSSSSSFFSSPNLSGRRLDVYHTKVW